MPTQQDILQAGETAGQSASRASDLTAGSYNVESVLKQKLDEAYQSNQDIVGPLDEATSTYLSSPSVAREKFQDIFNPFSRERLVSQYVNQEAIPMLSYSNILGSRRGSIADTIKAGTGAYQAQVAGAQGQAQADRQRYQDLLGQFESDRQFGLQQQNLALQQQKAGAAEKPGFDDWLKGIINSGDQDAIKQALVVGVASGEITPTDAKYLEDSVLGGQRLELEERDSLLERLGGLAGATDDVSRAAAFAEKIPIVKAFTEPEQSQTVLDIQTSSNLIGMEIARLFEKGRLSDKDREFYLEMMPSQSDIGLNPDYAKRKIQSVINYFESRYGTIGQDDGFVED